MFYVKFWTKGHKLTILSWPMNYGLNPKELGLWPAYFEGAGPGNVHPVDAGLRATTRVLLCAWEREWGWWSLLFLFIVGKQKAINEHLKEIRCLKWRCMAHSHYLTLDHLVRTWQGLSIVFGYSKTSLEKRDSRTIRCSRHGNLIYLFCFLIFCSMFHALKLSIIIFKKMIGK